DHFVFLDPTSLTIDLLKQHHLASETSAVAVGAARGTPRTPFFEGCSPSPLAPSYTSAAAVDVLSTEDVGAASASAKRCSSKGKGGKGGGEGSRSVGGGSSGGSGGMVGVGSGGNGGGGGGVGGGGGGSGCESTTAYASYACLPLLSYAISSTGFIYFVTPSPLAPSYTSAAAVDVLSTEDVGAASASAKRCSSKGKGGKGGGEGSRSVGGGSSGGSGGMVGVGSGGNGGGGGGVGGGGGGSGYLGTELRPATADPIGGVPRHTIRGTFREQQDVSRDSEVLLLAPNGSRCAAVRHLLRHVQRLKSSTQKKTGLLQPLPVPEQPWQVVSLDFIIGLPSTSRGHDSILVVIDKFSKMGHFIPTNATATAEATARLFFDCIITIHGIPATLISDRDPKFTSKFWKELMGLLGTKLAMSSAYHPQTDGQTERLNQVVEQLLRTACKDDVSHWDTQLLTLEFAYNNGSHAATGKTPFFLCYGREPLTPQQHTTPTHVQAAHDFVTTMQQLWEKTQRRLTTMQTSQKQYADRQRRDHSVAVGDQVLLDMRNLNLSHLPSKLRPRFCGPFLVEAQVTPVTFHLRLPNTWKLHNAFHVQLLKPYKDPNQQFQGRQLPPPPPVLIQEEPEYEVERVLTHRRRGGKTLEFLLRWKGYGPTEDSWVVEVDMGNARHALKDYLILTAVGVAVLATVAVVAKGLELRVEVQEEASGSGSSIGVRPLRPSSF
ncbi:unnamed protein product, partial [Closterium sp. NIES-54]